MKNGVFCINAPRYIEKPYFYTFQDDCLQMVLESFKNRLDIHLGVVSFAANIKRRDKVGEQLISILSISKAIDNKWQWAKNT